MCVNRTHTTDYCKLKTNLKTSKIRTDHNLLLKIKFKQFISLSKISNKNLKKTKILHIIYTMYVPQNISVPLMHSISSCL